MTYKKIFFKYVLILLIVIFSIHTFFFVGKETVRKVIESDRFFSFVMRNMILNLDKLSKYNPTAEEKKAFKESIEIIKKNWILD
jgi:hypothetical protein